MNYETATRKHTQIKFSSCSLITQQSLALQMDGFAFLTKWVTSTSAFDGRRGPQLVECLA